MTANVSRVPSALSVASTSARRLSSRVRGPLVAAVSGGKIVDADGAACDEPQDGGSDAGNDSRLACSTGSSSRDAGSPRSTSRFVGMTAASAVDVPSWHPDPHAVPQTTHVLDRDPQRADHADGRAIVRTGVCQTYLILNGCSYDEA